MAIGGVQERDKRHGMEVVQGYLRKKEIWTHEDGGAIRARRTHTRM